MDTTLAAEFETREHCITCGSAALETLSEGRFSDEPLRTFMAEDPFGENPLPYLEHADWAFVKCTSCGQKFHQKILNEEWIGVYYNRWISSDAIAEFSRAAGNSGFQADFKKGQHAVERILQLERLTRALRGDDPVRVLDFGCGDGQFLATATHFGFECVGVEFSAARHSRRRVEFFGDLEQVSREHQTGTFHAAVLFEVLEHLTEPLATLRAIKPFLKTGGILILETPNCPDVTGIETMNDYRLIDPLGHINAFTPETQERIAKEAGFRRISPSVVQCTADPIRAYKREVKRLLGPVLKRYTQQYFVAE